MVQPQTGQKLLRVALIQGSKITEDRTLRRRGSVTIGQNATNTIVVPVSNLPASFQLFELDKDAYTLNFTATMEGEVFVEGRKISLKELATSGKAQKRGDSYSLPLSDAAKGRVALGEVSLLFQFVTPPTEAPKMDLPPEIRGTVFRQIDQFFFLILAGSLFVHFSGATFIACQPKVEERELSLEEFSDRFAKVIIPETKPPPPTETKDSSDKKDETKEEKKEPTEKKAGKEKAPTSNADEQKAAMQAKVAKSGLLKVIGAAAGGSGAFEDVLGGSSGVGDVTSALSGASGVGVATADSLAAGGPKGGAAGSAAGIGDLGTSGGGNVALAEKGTAAVRGGVSMQAPEVESKDVDREKLASYVRGRKGAIQQCYEKELKRNPSLKGKVVVRFNITPSGRTSEIEIEENTLGNEAVASCIRTTIRTWIFPFKPDSDVPVAYPFVFAPAS